MGEPIRRVAVPAASIAALGYAAIATWWTVDDELELEVGLTGARRCLLGVCATSDPPSLWGTLGLLVLLVLAVTALVLTAASVQVLRHADARGLFGATRKLGVLTMIASAGAALDAIVGYGGTPGLGPLCALAGGLGAIVAGAADRAADDGVAVGPVASPAVATGRAVEPGGLRFAVGAATLTATGLAIDDRRGHRDLAWADVVRVDVRRLPPDPPWEKAPLLDLVTTTGVVRLTARTRVDYPSLPGGAAPGMKENWRRLIAHARSINPAIAIAPEAEPFVAGGEPPMFAAWKQFLAYDTTYGA